MAKNDLFCVQQRLNTLEEHNMTIDDVITCLDKHSRQEPRAYYITKALNIAIDFLKNHRWHYPSKGELPEEGREVVIYYKGGVADFGSYALGLNGWHNKFGDSISEPYMWISLKPPKEMKC